jgi:hypothetical protein
MVEVEITNYESIAHTKLVIDGFTTLIGRNYLGKSAVLRAINAALINKDGTEFIRWGQTFCEVHLKFQDLDILWHKEDGNNFYKVNGKEYTKIGRGTPPQEILDAGYKPIAIGDEKINLNYAVQFFPLFLVNKRDSKSADILTSAYGLDRIYTSIDLCNKDQRTNSDLLRIREKDLGIVENGLKKFQKMPDILSRIPEIKNKKKDIDAQETEIKKVSGWVLLLRDLAVKTKRLKGVSEVRLPESSKILEDIKSYGTLVRYYTGYSQLSSFVNKVSPVQSIKIPEDHISKIKDMFAEYQKLIIWNSSYNKLSKETDRLKKIEKIKLPSHSINVEDVPKLEAFRDRLSTCALEYKECDKKLAVLTSDMAAVEKELESFDACPLCGAKRG